MADDLTLRLISSLVEKPAVRPAFAEALRAELHRELGFVAQVEPTQVSAAVTTGARAPVRTARRPWLRLVPALRPLTLRVALLTALALVLLAGTALAVYLVARAWLSAGDRGPQFTNDFWLTEAFSQPDAMYADVHLAADGKSLVAFRQPTPEPGGTDQIDHRQWAIVRISLDGSDAVETVMPLESLRMAIDWDAGADPQRGVVRRSPTAIGGDLLSVASNGDLFASVSLAPTGGGAPPTSSALVVIHPDGRAQKVVTARELADAGLLSPLTASNGLAIAATPSAPDRLWARAEAAVEDGPTGHAFWLYEIIDPNADGDWSDRVVRPLTLPATVPDVEYGQYDWLYEAFVAEPTLAGRERSRSVLMPMTGPDNEYRLYRIADWNDDGDALDADEAELLFSGTGGPDVVVGMTGPVVAPRLVLDGSQVVLDEQILGGLTRTSRVSRLTKDGLIDVLRALPSPIGAVAATTDGSIYVASQREATSESGWEYAIYRLTPVEPGATPPPDALTPTPSSPAESVRPPTPSPSPAAQSPLPTNRSTPSASPVATPSAAPTEALDIDLRPLTPDVSQIRFVNPLDEFDRLLVGTDGSGPALLMSDWNPQDLCLSTDGTRIAFVSDVEVPNEYFVYVADSDGENVTLASDRVGGFECPFTSDFLVTWQQQEKYFRYDLDSGREKLIYEGLGFVSPDGRLLMTPGGATLGVVDVATGAHRQIAGPLGGDTWTLSWSPDSRMIAFVVKESDDFSPDGASDIYVADVGREQARLTTTTHGIEPDIAWSSDSTKLTLLVPSETYRPDGTYTIVTVDLSSGDVTTLADTGAKWAAWSPTDPSTFAYATPDAVVVIEHGVSRTLISAPEDAPPDWWEGFWLGWSPDGRYLGHSGSSDITMVDAANGEQKVIWSNPPGLERQGTAWWR